jgi:hypothetical protein
VDAVGEAPVPLGCPPSSHQRGVQDVPVWGDEGPMNDVWASRLFTFNDMDGDFPDTLVWG